MFYSKVTSGMRINIVCYLLASGIRRKDQGVRTKGTISSRTLAVLFKILVFDWFIKTRRKI